MTNAGQQRQKDAAPRRVVMIVYPDAHILDVVGPLEVLTGAKLFLPENIKPYDVHVVAEKAGSIRTTSGLTIEADQSFADAAMDTAPIDTLMIAGGHGTVEALEHKELLNFVRQAAGRADRIVSICTGAMILAEIGLLNGRRATTHWWWCPILKSKYPEVEVEPDAIYVRDGNIWTSAGVTTGMDLALSLVEADWGHDVALQVARYNVMYMMRPGGQSQFSAHLVAQKAEDPVINETLSYILANLTDPLTVTALAARAAMSERTFARKFKDETGVTPAHYVEAARVQSARVELEQSDTGVEQIALHAGFQNAERMRRVFQRHVGVSAADYRQRFRPVGAQIFAPDVDSS
ncbi:GlxA family transcriptional regulator [Ponticaulis sp.]|uniref:GlxA family transcriptional regulator n=1 Tax=Ponticaulis sp. TaxID=2020902 RepID=UPI0025E79601|nr:GlxA family transcriptional regulator [Ponticaulis sp.]|tara:strand:- start:5003 stop:6049 length:1047 start_codon:yes stop_codon:yes gene_type:complete